MLSMARPEPLLDTEEAAAFLGMRPQTLRKWRWAGTSPPYIRLGRGNRARPKYRREDLEAWMKERTWTSTSAETEARRKEGGR